MTNTTKLLPGTRVGVRHSETDAFVAFGTIMAGIAPAPNLTLIQYDDFADLGSVHIVAREGLSPIMQPLPPRRPHLSEL